MKICYPVICRTHNTKIWVIAIVEREWKNGINSYSTTYLWNKKEAHPEK